MISYYEYQASQSHVNNFLQSMYDLFMEEKSIRKRKVLLKLDDYFHEQRAVRLNERKTRLSFSIACYDFFLEPQIATAPKTHAAVIRTYEIVTQTQRLLLYKENRVFHIPALDIYLLNNKWVITGAAEGHIMQHYCERLCGYINTVSQI